MPFLPDLDYRALFLSILLLGPSLLPAYVILSSLFHSPPPLSPSSLLSPSLLTDTELSGNIEEQRLDCRSTRAQSQEVDA